MFYFFEEMFSNPLTEIQHVSQDNKVPDVIEQLSLNTNSENTTKIELSKIFSEISSILSTFSDPKNITIDDCNKIKQLLTQTKDIPYQNFQEIDFFNTLQNTFFNNFVSNNIKIILLDIIQYSCCLNYDILNNFMKDLLNYKIFKTAIEMNENPDFVAIGCKFFIYCLNYEDIIDIMHKTKNFFSYFVDLLNRNLNSIYKDPTNELLHKTMIELANLFTEINRKVPQKLFSTNQEKIQSTIISIFHSPINKQIIKYVAHTVAAITQNSGFSKAIIQSEMFQLTINLIFNPEMYEAYKYSIALANNCICHYNSSLEPDIIVDIISTDFFNRVLEILNAFYIPTDITAFIQNDQELLRNIFYYLMTMALDGSEIVANFLEPFTFETILGIIDTSSYTIRLLGIEFLWTLLVSGTSSQALQIIGNEKALELLLEILEGDDEYLTDKIINYYIGPFVDKIVRHNPNEFQNFIESMKDPLNDLADIDELASISERILSFISTIYSAESS